MLKKMILLLFCLVFSWSALSDVLQLVPNAPKSYVVKKGDTLWDISGIFLKKPWYWPKLWRINPEIDNPHLIYPGDQLSLVFDSQGQPMLVKGKPILKWSPKTRITLKDQNPIQTISLNVISPFIKYDTVLTKEELNSAPYVLGSDEGYKLNVDAFKVYVNGDLKVGKAYAIYQKEEEIYKPESGEVIGYHARLIATGKAIGEGDSNNKKPSTLYLEGSVREVRAGTIVKPVNEGQSLPSFFAMQPAGKMVKGSIVKSSTGNREFGKLEVIFIDQGSQHGVNQGDVLSVKRLSPSIVETAGGPVYTTDTSRWNRMAAESNSDYNMPEETIGNIMVFKVFEFMSMALILNSEKALRLQDIVEAPQ